MKLVRFELGGAGPRLGIVKGDRIIDLSENDSYPATMIDLIEQWDDLQAAAGWVESQPGHHALSEVRLLAPIPRPGKILALGLNYADHAAEADMEVPSDPFWFCKQGTCINDDVATGTASAAASSA